MYLKEGSDRGGGSSSSSGGGGGGGGCDGGGTAAAVSHSPLPTCVHAQSAMSTLDEGPARRRICWSGRRAERRTSRERSARQAHTASDTCRNMSRVEGYQSRVTRRAAPGSHGTVGQKDAPECSIKTTGLVVMETYHEPVLSRECRAWHPLAWRWRGVSSGGGGRRGRCCGR